MRRRYRAPDWYREFAALAALSGVKRLRRLVQDADLSGLLPQETQPITVRQARELLAMVDDGARKLIRPRYEVQQFVVTAAAWQAVAPVPSKQDGLRVLRAVAERNPAEDYRLVRLVPKVLALCVGKGRG